MFMTSASITSAHRSSHDPADKIQFFAHPPSPALLGAQITVCVQAARTLGPKNQYSLFWGDCVVGDSRGRTGCGWNIATFAPPPLPDFTSVDLTLYTLVRCTRMCVHITPTLNACNLDNFLATFKMCYVYNF
jgi:hypothetical protein